MAESTGLIHSMSRKGNPLDNAFEIFFPYDEGGVSASSNFRYCDDAAAHIVEYIEFYNHEKPHSALGFQSPPGYEKLCA